MSSPELQRGLLATCVASRCRVLASAEDRALVWFLQKLSWQPGGLENVVSEILTRWPERFFPEGRAESDALEAASKIELTLFEKDEFDPARHCLGTHIFHKTIKRHLKVLLEENPRSEPGALGQLCRDAADAKVEGVNGLANFLFRSLCLDPAVQPESWRTWYLPSLRQTLLDYQALWVDRTIQGLALTQITEKVFDALDYSLEMQGLVLVQGLERRGKTFSAKAWCDLHPGEARYVKTPSTSDDGGFFREIARSLGIGCGQSIKTVELRDRIEETLLGGDLMLVFDNAHFLFRQAMYREAIPQRLTWVLTALVDEDIPVALISTPQFTVAQQLTAEKSKWRDKQLSGRIIHFEQLPEVLSVDDLTAVAQAWLPGANEASVRLLVTYAQASDKYLQAIGSLAQRALYLAKKHGRDQPTLRDIKEALQTGVIPSDNAVSEAIESAKAHVHRRASAGSPTMKRARASRMHVSDITDSAAVEAPAEEERRDVEPNGEITLVPDRNFSRSGGSSVKAETLEVT